MHSCHRTRDRFSSWTQIAALSIALGSATAAQSSHNLLSNADFEGPAVADGDFDAFASITGWTAEAGMIELQNNIGDLIAVSNEQHLELDSLSVIRQVANTQPGQSYALSFAFSPRPGAPEMTFEVYYADSLIETIVVPAAGSLDWDYRSYALTGASLQDAVEFRDLTGGGLGVLIDDVALIPWSPGFVEHLRNGQFEQDPVLEPGASMERPVFEGWYSLQNSEVEVRNVAGTPEAYQGAQVLDMDEEWGVGQYVHVVAGQDYTLSFAATPSASTTEDRVFEVWFGEELVDTLTLDGSGGTDWQVYNYTVSSHDPSTSVAFQDRSGSGNGALIDSVSLRGPRAEENPNGLVLSHKIIRRNQGAGLFIGNQDMFARSIDVIGDLDGDGVQDLAVGAIGDDDGGNNTGAVWILFMNADRSVRSSQKISELRGNFNVDLGSADGFGRALAGIGDLDGDGVVDLAVGANRDDDGAGNAGACYILFLNTDGTVRDHHKISATSGDNLSFVPGDDPRGHEFGGSVAGMGDMDGDGVNDIAIGARHGDSVQICFMNTDGTVRESTNLSFETNGFTGTEINTDSWGELWGMSCANMGDFDGDGVNDLLVGGYCRTIWGMRCTGAQYLLLLNSDGTCKDWFYYGPEAINPTGQYIGHFYEFAVACTPAGDVDGDGTLDILVGAHREGSLFGLELNEASMNGAAYLLFLNPNGTIKSSLRIGDRAGGWDVRLGDRVRWGESMISLGDWDGNGKVDVAVGSRFIYNTGAAFLMELDGGASAPLASAFEASPVMGAAPLDVDFTSQSVGEITSYLWDFGDGSSSTEENPTHTYTEEGLYTVSLSIANAEGDEDTSTQPDLIQVGDTTLPGVVALGCGVNPDNSIVILDGTLQVGTTIQFGVDNPLGTQAVGSIPSVSASWRSDPGFPCGSPRADRNMAGPGIDGELLIGRVFRAYTGAAWAGAGIPAPVNVAIPNNVNLVGRKLYVQGRLADDSPGATVPLGFANGFEITLQP